jgi:hypothetical protein
MYGFYCFSVKLALRISYLPYMLSCIYPVSILYAPYMLFFYMLFSSRARGKRFASN